MRKTILLLIFLISFFLPIKLDAYNLNKKDKIYVSGGTIGIELNTRVMIMGTYGIASGNKIQRPWEKTNIKEGDIILSFNNTNINSIKAFLKEIASVEGKETAITVLREKKEISSTIQPVLKDNNYCLGLYIKDHLMGVGTLTYVIPGVNIFGSLGHSITDMESFEGKIYEATVNSIVKSERNKAGEKRATLIDGKIGEITKNSTTGIHGVINDKSTNLDMKLMNFKTRDEIKLGKASILTCIDGKNINEYSVEITKLEKQKTNDIKGIKLKVTDQELINKCGGIVQGMSGSPIIQDNKIIGAITHVLLSNPKEGYGIYLEFMLEDMDVFVVED